LENLGKKFHTEKKLKKKLKYIYREKN
jgi:hypothetical protein